jgi:biotin carboxyl carrier protein
MVASSAVALERYLGDGKRFDYVIEVDGERAVLYLAKKPTNEPIAHVKPVFIAEHGHDDKLVFKATSSAGIYEAAFDEYELPEGHLVVSMDGEKNVVEVHNEEEGHGHDEHGHEGHGHGEHSLWEYLEGWSGRLLLLLVGLGLGLGFPFARRRWETFRRARAGVIVLAIAFSGVWSSRGFCGDGHDHGEVEIGGSGKGSVEVVISKKSQFLIELRTVAATKSDVAEALHTFGHVGPKPSLDSMVRSPIPGFLRGVTQLPWGSKVKRGERLATVDGISAVGVHSPVDGVLMESAAVEGTRVNAGDQLFRVVDMSSLWVDAEVFQKDLPRLQSATGVAIALEGDYPAMRGKMSGARTVVDVNTLSAKVFIEIENPSENIPLGVVAQVAFELPGKSTTGFVLPKGAILDRGGERLVYIQTGPETFLPKPVSVIPGFQINTVVVTQGLSEGDRVVTQGNYQLLVGAK